MHSDRLGALPDAGEVALPAGKRFHLDFKSSEYAALGFMKIRLYKMIVISHNSLSFRSLAGATPPAAPHSQLELQHVSSQLVPRQLPATTATRDARCRSGARGAAQASHDIADGVDRVGGPRERALGGAGA